MEGPLQARQTTHWHFFSCRAAPSSRAKIRVNSILNASGKRGSRLGNGLAVLGLYYTTAEHLLDRYEVDKYLGGEDWINPILAAGSTGMLYKCTAGPRTMALAGAVGIMGMGAVIASQTLLGSLGSGQRSRSRA
jgi:import inner membrane translocase subunit TIM23